MCPACVITIGGGLLLAKNLGVSNLLIIGLVVVFLSLLTDKLLRKINHGKVFFPYQRIVVSIIILLIVMVVMGLKI